MKVEIDSRRLKELSEIAIKNDTMSYFIPIAIEWAECAEAEIVRLNKLLEEKEE